MFNIYNNRKSFLSILLMFPVVLAAQDYYFVAGEDGRWSNIENWRTSSGGSVQHKVVPFANDNVSIDASSFPGNVDELLVDRNLATCGDLRVSTGRPFKLEGRAGNTWGSCGVG